MEAEGSMPTTVLLVSPNRLLNITLSSVVQDELELSCELCGLKRLRSLGQEACENPEISAYLLLMDYLGYRADVVCQAIREFQELASPVHRVSALFNVPRGIGIEHRVLALGARGVFYDDFDLQLFKKGVIGLLEGDIWFPRKILFEHIQHNVQTARSSEWPNNGGSSLTPREEEILLMIASGRTNAEIAGELSISSSTVKTHVYNIFQKVGVTNRIQAALWTAKNLGSGERVDLE
jgi:LuxR family transcriptional regulator of csgAB operon